MKTEIRYGKRIREARLVRGWTQEHLAEIADIAPRTVARIEKEEVRGSESLMAIAAAFEVKLRELATIVRIAEVKPLRSFLVRQPEDLQIAFSRGSHSGLYRTLLLPMRDDYRERAAELLEMIFCDLQYLSPDESDIVRSWVGAAKEPLTELHAMGMEIFTIQDNREGFIGEPGHKQLLRVGRLVTTCWCWNTVAFRPEMIFIASMTSAPPQYRRCMIGFGRSKTVRT